MATNFNYLTGDFSDLVIHRYKEEEKERGWELMSYFCAASW